MASPEAASAFWSRIHAAVVTRELSQSTLPLLLWHAVGGDRPGRSACPHALAPVDTLAALLAALAAPGADPDTKSPYPHYVDILSLLHVAAAVPDGPRAAGACATLLAAGANVRGMSHGRLLTPLHTATTWEATQVLLAAGADPNAPSRDFPNALFSPAALRDARVCRAFLAVGASPQAPSQTPSEATPLHGAESVGVVLALLAAGADATAVTTTGKGTLCCPAALEDVDACCALLAAGADPNPSSVGNAPSPHAPLSSATSPEVVAALLRAGAKAVPASGPHLPVGVDHDLCLASPLFSPAARHHAGACRALLAAGARPDDGGVQGTQPLHVAGSAEVVTALLHAGATPGSSPHRRTPLGSPAARRDAQACAALVVVGVDVNYVAGGCTPLHMAASVGTLQVLLAAGASVAVAEEAGGPLLVGPAPAEDASLCCALLAAGACVNGRSTELMEGTPLHAARTADVAAALVAHGASVHATNLLGRTPLHTAACAGVAAVLLATGASVHVEDILERTPLHTATSPDVVRVLLDAGE